MTEHLSGAPRLSPRLEKIAEFAENGLRLADVGTDHAFIPIVLLKKGSIPSAYALDIHEGPLKRAAEHLTAYGVRNRVELRLSDGLSAMEPGEAESVLIAGMGGGLMIRILRDAFERAPSPDGRTFRNTVKEWIFSPHTEWEEFRKFLLESDLRIVREELVLEECKFYLVLKASAGDAEAPYLEAQRAGFSPDFCFRFGPLMLLRRDPLLLSFLKREQKKEAEIVAHLIRNAADPSTEVRRKELQEDLSKISKLIQMFRNSDIMDEYNRLETI